MENPGQLIRRAKQNRRLKEVRSPMHTQGVQPQVPPEPQHKSAHASYTALMRSHDRMRTRHLPGQG